MMFSDTFQVAELMDRGKRFQPQFDNWAIYGGGEEKHFLKSEIKLYLKVVQVADMEE